jgi:hypothetical protein
MKEAPMFKKWLVALVLAAPPVLAQESAGFKLTEHVFNGGGHPHRGVVMSSPGFRVSLDSIGESVLSHTIGSGSFRANGGFAPAYLPPREIVGLRFTDGETLQWDAQAAAAGYNLYRGSLGNLTGLELGTCEEQDLVAATVTDPDLPSGGDGFFYLATAMNRLGEKGTRGFQSDGSERDGTACP